MLEKKENETQYEYGLRLIQNKVDGNIDVDWSELCSVLKLDVHADSLRKACNVTPYSGVQVAKYYQQKIEEIILNSQDDSKGLLEELEEKRKEIYKERVKLQDERRYKNNMYRQESRAEMLVDEFLHAIDEMKYTKPIDFGECEVKKVGRVNVASLMLSDMHIGMESDTFANKFNFAVVRNRLVKLYKEVVSKCELHSVGLLHIEICGDLIDGALRTSSRILQEADVVRQVIYCEEVLSDFIVALAKKIPNIIVHSAVGNHSRMTPDLSAHIHSENFEYLIMKGIMVRVKEQKNIIFNENVLDSEIAIYNVFDKTIASVHGHREKKIFESASILSDYLKMKIDEVHMGHFHQFAIKNNVIVNGAFSGVGDYAQGLRYSTDPSQTLIIYENNINKCIYDINLK